MPTTTLDLSCPNGAQIPIEERPGSELTELAGHAIAPKGIDTWNPAFDVTPANLITSWITEQGIWSPAGGFTSTTQG